MNSQAAINSFFSSSPIAVVGVSRDSKKFGSVVYKTLKENGIAVLPVNKNADTIQGDSCFQSVAALHGKANSAVLVVPPHETMAILEDAVKSGISQIWFQPGSQSAAATAYCDEHNLHYVTGQCILMHAEPVKGFHKFHRFLKKLNHSLPR
jgi:hypothetical protein